MINKTKHTITLLLFLFSIIACDSNKKIKTDMQKLQSKKIDLCIDSMQYYVSKPKCGEEIDSSLLYTSNMALVIYSDTSVCSSCTVKGMYRWFEILDNIKEEYGNFVKVYFIFSPLKKDINELKISLKTSLFEYPVFIDTANVFSRHNKHLPNDKRMHSFLLDKERNVVLVGSPLNNISIRELFYQIVSNYYNKLN